MTGRHAGRAPLPARAEGPGDHEDVEVTELAMAHREFVCAWCGRYRTEPRPDTLLQDDLDDDEGDHRG